MSWRRRSWWDGIAILCFAVIMVFVAVICVYYESERKNSVGVPRMEMFLNGVSLDVIHENGKDLKYEHNSLSLDGEYYNNVEIKGRGNYTWNDDKKSYRLKFNGKVDLLGLGAVRKWALISNNMDDAYLRNDLGFYIAKMVDSEYPFSGDFLDFTVDGEDLGLYYVTHVVEISKRVLDLRDEDGMIIELDNGYCKQEPLNIDLASGDCVTVKDMVTDDNMDKNLSVFIEQINRAQEVVADGDYKKMTEILDIESFARYFVVNEFVANPDAYVTSFFMYKNGVDDKIHAGPAWDFDSAFGNRRWGDGAMNEGFYAPETVMARRWNAFGKSHYDEVTGEWIVETEDLAVSKMMYNMVEIPEFWEEVKRVYRETLLGRRDEVLAYIQKRSGRIRNAAMLDGEKWGKMDFDDAIRYLNWWVDQRFLTLDRVLGEKIQLPMKESVM